jgi:hypothetical protein
MFTYQAIVVKKVSPNVRLCEVRGAIIWSDTDITGEAFESNVCIIIVRQNNTLSEPYSAF